MPLPEIQIFGGGAHAQGRIDLQDIMALPVGAPDWRTALDWCARVYQAAGSLLAESGQSARRRRRRRLLAGRQPATKRCSS